MNYPNERITNLLSEATDETISFEERFAKFAEVKQLDDEYHDALTPNRYCEHKAMLLRKQADRLIERADRLIERKG